MYIISVSTCNVACAALVPKEWKVFKHSSKKIKRGRYGLSIYANYNICVCTVSCIMHTETDTVLLFWISKIWHVFQILALPNLQSSCSNNVKMVLHTTVVISLFRRECSKFAPLEFCAFLHLKKREKCFYVFFFSSSCVIFFFF